MAQQGFYKISEFEPDKLLAGNKHPFDTRAVALAATDKELKRGTLISQAGDIVASSSDVPVGILCDDITLTSDGANETLIYISGTFKASEIILDSETLTAWDFELELQKLGIFLK